MSQLQIDWAIAPAWANWAAQDANGGVFWYANEPFRSHVSEHWHCHDGDSACAAALKGVVRVGPKAAWRESLTRRSGAAPQQAVDHGATLRAQIGHLLEEMTPERLDALYAHVRKVLDAAKLDELNRQLDRPFGEVPREWQLKAFEAFLDGHGVAFCVRHDWVTGPEPIWHSDTRYRIEPKQS